MLYQVVRLRCAHQLSLLYNCPHLPWSYCIFERNEQHPVDKAGKNLNGSYAINFSTVQYTHHLWVHLIPRSWDGLSLLFFRLIEYAIKYGSSGLDYPRITGSQAMFELQKFNLFMVVFFIWHFCGSYFFVWISISIWYYFSFVLLLALFVVWVCLQWIFLALICLKMSLCHFHFKKDFHKVSILGW